MEFISVKLNFNTMDILYILGTGSSWNNNEIKYSLRSIAKYGKNIDKVVIVGEKPKFVNDSVICIPCGDVMDKKHKNILNKIITAANSGLISDHFLISSDDHFYVKETDFDLLPVYYKSEIIKGSNKNEYKKSLLETKNFLINHDISTYQTNPHCNTHFDVNVYNKYKALFDEGMQLQNGVETNCLMGNLLIQEGYKPEHYRDIKVRSLNELKTKL